MKKDWNLEHSRGKRGARVSSIFSADLPALQETGALDLRSSHVEIGRDVLAPCQSRNRAAFGRHDVDVSAPGKSLSAGRFSTW